MMKYMKLILGISMLVISLTLTSCSPKSSEQPKKESMGLSFFKESYSDAKIIKHSDGDINSDGKDDTVVIFSHEHEGKKEIAFTVILSGEGGFKKLDHYRAPLDNQNIDIKDTDGDKLNEFVISGSKNGELGIGIYKIEKDKVIDLFGSGSMDAC
ncbi:MAG: Cys-Cys-COOH (seleno)protein SaoC [Clostridium sp.]